MSECVEDFCGRITVRPGLGTQINMWADWDGQKVVFGGAYKVPSCPVPDMPSLRRPTDRALDRHVAKYWNVEKWWDYVIAHE